MSFRELLIINLSLFGAYLIDSSMIQFANQSFLEISTVYLVFFYWSYAAPQQFTLALVILSGILLDFLTASFLGTHTLIFIFFSLVIRSYTYRLRLFSNLQIALIFALLSSIGFTFKYLFIYPESYLYSKLIFNFFTTIIILPLIFAICRYLRRHYTNTIK
jgi:rod shape-determining protein MreD